MRNTGSFVGKLESGSREPRTGSVILSFFRGGDLVNYVSLSNGWPEKERKEAAAALTPELRIKTFDRMEEEEKVEVILTLIPYLKCKFLQLFHTCKHMPLEYVIKLKNQLEILSKRGTTIINFSTVKSLSDIGKDPGLDIIDLPYWEKEVESYESIS